MEKANKELFAVVNTNTGEIRTDYLGRPRIYADERSANAALLSMNQRDRKKHFVDMYFDESVSEELELSEMVENQKVVKELSPAAQKFIMDLRRKKKAQIEKGVYAISVYFETLQGENDEDGFTFDFTEAVVRGMAKQRSGWIAKVVKRFDYEGKKFKDKDHVVLFGKNIKAEKKKGWTDPKLISEGYNMDIKNIIKSIVEKKLEKDSDDPCWDGYVKLGTKMKDGKEVPNCVPKESVDDVFMRDQGGSGSAVARGTVERIKGYNNWWAKNRAGTMKIFDSEKEAKRFAMTKESVELEEKATDYASYDDYVAATKRKGLQVLPRKLWNNLKKDSMKESTDLFERVEVSHDRYMRSHGKKARGRGMWIFTSKNMGEPKSDEMVTVSGSLSSAAKEAAKKLGVDRVYVMESTSLEENFKVGDRVRNPYKDDMYGGAKRFGKVTDVRGSGKRLVVSVDWGEGPIDYLPNSGDKMDQLVVESVELGESFKVGDRVRNPYKDDMYGGKKRFGKVTAVRGTGKGLVVSVDWGSGSVDYLPNSSDKMDQLVVESIELTEDVHNDLNDAIIDFQRKLMRTIRQLDPAIAKEVKKIDKDLDDLRTGPLFKIRPGR